MDGSDPIIKKNDKTENQLILIKKIHIILIDSPDRYTCFCTKARRVVVDKSAGYEHVQIQFPVYLEK